MSDEIWKPLPAPLSKYEVSDHGGRVRNIRRGNVLTGRPGNKGYYLIKLYDDDGKQQTRTVHSLVLLAHRGARPPGQEACHGDDNPAHNDLSNLRWDTKPANRSDRRENAPPKLCARCGGPFKGNGKRCHPCVVEIGEKGGRAAAFRHFAARRRGGPRLSERRGRARTRCQIRRLRPATIRRRYSAWHFPPPTSNVTPRVRHAVSQIAEGGHPP